MRRFIGCIEIRQHYLDKFKYYKLIHYYVLSWVDTIYKFIHN